VHNPQSGLFLYAFDFDVAAKHVGIGIRRFPKEMLVVGLDGEKRRVYTRKYA
jgi:hypothetical protein